MSAIHIDVPVYRDAFGRVVVCECCGADHLVVQTVERWVASTVGAPWLQDGFLLAGEGRRLDARLAFCHECFCIAPL